MIRSAAFGLVLGILGLSGGGACAEVSAAAPRQYELLLNGESFLVEADRQVRLESKVTPGLVYDVALRVAVQQPLQLNTLRLDYDWPAQIEDDRGAVQRTVKVHHKLGYTVLLTDLGQVLTASAQVQALEGLTQSVVEGLTESGMQKINPSKPYPAEFVGVKARGVTIRYQDKEGFHQTCLAYLLAGEKFTGSCVVQYFDNDRETVLPRIKAMLDSVRPVR